MTNRSKKKNKKNLPKKERLQTSLILRDKQLSIFICKKKLTPFRCASFTTSPKSVIEPVVSGYWTKIPATFFPEVFNLVISPTSSSRPKEAALVAITLIDWGWTLSETKIFFLLVKRQVRARASAAEVPSSSNEALATSKPVKSLTIVW